MSPAADSAGQPFAGRSFEANPFQGDTGECDPDLERALKNFVRARQLADRDASEKAFAAVIDVLAQARLLSPLVAEAGDWGLTDEGHTVEKTQELSIVHVQGPDGRAVAPVFSSVKTLMAWNASARPVPVRGSLAALACASDGLALMVLDPGSDHSVAIRGGSLRAVATGQPYRSPGDQPEVLEAVTEGWKNHQDAVVSFELRPGDPTHTLAGPEVVVILTLVPGLSPEKLSDLLASITDAWSENEVLLQRVDGLGVKVVSA